MAMPQGVLAREAEQPTDDQVAAPAGAQKAPAAKAGAAKKPDDRTMELFNLVVGRVRAALAQQGQNLDAALKADPVSAAVQFGTLALRSVVQAAQRAGKAIPVEIIIAAGMQTIKDVAEIASDKGYLPDDQLDGFMKEVFQQSLQQYAQADKAEGAGPPDGVLARQAMQQPPQQRAPQGVM